MLNPCNIRWSRISALPLQATEAYHIPFLSRNDVSNGANHAQEPAETDYVDINGNNSSDAARQLITELLGKLGYEPVPLPQP